MVYTVSPDPREAEAGGCSRVDWATQQGFISKKKENRGQRSAGGCLSVCTLWIYIVPIG